METARPVPRAGLSWLALASLAVALVAMAVDHLLGTERAEGERGLADPATFAISAVLVLVAATLLFGRIVPGARARGPERAAAVGLVCGVLAIVPGIAVAWLGIPFVLAGAGADLGLGARHGARRGVALTAVVLGVGALGAGAVGYMFGAVQGISEL